MEIIRWMIELGKIYIFESSETSVLLSHMALPCLENLEALHIMTPSKLHYEWIMYDIKIKWS